MSILRRVESGGIYIYAFESKGREMFHCQECAIEPGDVILFSRWGVVWHLIQHRRAGNTSIPWSTLVGRLWS